MNLISLFESTKIDYNKYVLLCKDVCRQPFFDISVIIPVRGRIEFYDTIVDALKLSAENSGLSIAITYVEHSFTPIYFYLNKASYIHIPATETQEFNKCLCFNIGFLYGPKADKYLFHDSDLLCSDTFFSSIYDFNGIDAVQAFKNKRVLYASEYLTDIIIKKEQPYNKLDENHPNIQVGTPGAPGGSLLVSRYLFELVGGYDPEFFSGYSVEDQFFHDKISLFDTVSSLDNENLVHLNHGSSHAVSKQADFDIYNYWKGLNDIWKFDLMKAKSDHLKKFL